jgi:hypothetical protein
MCTGISISKVRGSVHAGSENSGRCGTSQSGGVHPGVLTDDGRAGRRVRPGHQAEPPPLLAGVVRELLVGGAQILGRWLDPVLQEVDGLGLRGVELAVVHA